MWGAVCIISQPFFQVCSAGVQREIQTDFGSGVLTALKNTDLLGTDLFYHTRIWMGSKYGGFSALPPSTNICGQVVIMFFVSFHKFWWISCQAQIHLTTFQLAFPPFLSPWWYTFICNLVSGSASVRISSFLWGFCHCCFSKYPCSQYCSILRTCLFWGKHCS